MSQYATFTVGELRVGVAVDHVHEILSAPRYVRMPFAPEGVLGLLNRRGEIVTVLDAGALLGAAPVARPDAVHVVVTLGGETVSLAVDGGGDVVTTDPERSHPVPETIKPALRRALEAVIELDDGGVMVALHTEQPLAGDAA